MKQLTILTFFFLIIQSGFSQSEIPQLATACKDIRNQKEVKFHYVIRAEGVNLLHILRKEDVTSCTGLSAIVFTQLASQDLTLKNLPMIPEGQYAEWNEVEKDWELKKGGVEEIIEVLKNKRTLGECLQAHTGKFKYKNSPDPTAYIIRTGTQHIEHYNNDEHSSVFEIKWISDCEYELTFIKTNDPELTFIRKGDKLTVSIWNVSGQGYDYKSNFKGMIRTNSHIKIE